MCLVELQYMPDLITTVAILSLVANVVVNILMEDDNILSGYAAWLCELEKKRPMLAKPLGYCDKCFAGQLALWSGIYVYWELYYIDPVQAAIAHLCTILITIYTTYILSKTI